MSVVTIYGEDIKFWERRGFVDSFHFQSRTHVWSEGGGGYVHPQHGGYVDAPNVRSQVVDSKEVRLTFTDNLRETVKLDGRMTFDKDDDVSLVYACPVNSPTGQLVGVVNHTEGRWWTYGLESPTTFRWSRKLKNILLASLGSLVLCILTINNPNLHFGVLAIALYVYACVVRHRQHKQFQRGTSECIAAELGRMTDGHNRHRVNQQPTSLELAPVHV